MYGSYFSLSDNFPDQVFNEFERLQRQLAGRDTPSNIRPVARGAFPAINLGSTSTSVEIYAFLPGVDAQSIDIQIDKNLLTLAGERHLSLQEEGDQSTVYAQERFSGEFKRVVNLPDDVDVNNVTARYKDGVLRISILRREETLPKKIEIQ